MVDAAYNVLAWNQLATHFIGDLSRYEDRNMIRRPRPADGLRGFAMPMRHISALEVAR